MDPSGPFNRQRGSQISATERQTPLRNMDTLWGCTLTHASPQLTPSSGCISHFSGIPYNVRRCVRETTRPSMVRPATYPTASATFTSVDHPHRRTSCTPGTDGCIGCLLWWMVQRSMRPRTSIARLVAPPAPTNYLVGGYWGAVKSGRPSTRPPKKSILMISFARPQP